MLPSYVATCTVVLYITMNFTKHIAVYTAIATVLSITLKFKVCAHIRSSQIADTIQLMGLNSNNIV